MDDRPSNRYCKVIEVAQFFGVSPSTVYQWIYDDMLPVVKYTFELPSHLEEKPIRRYFFHNKDIFAMDAEGRARFGKNVPRKKYPSRLAKIKKGENK